MVIAYHAIFTAYGFWLPNDPRGSWSDFVASWELFKYGPATKTDTRRSVAGASHNQVFRKQAKQGLKYPPVNFTGIQARAIGQGFAEAIKHFDYMVHACSILPDHVHLVVARHTHKIETIVAQLKGQSTKRMTAQDIHPMLPFRTGSVAIPTCWARKCWKVFLNDATDVTRAIRYVEANPGKECLPAQSWRFVTPYGGAGTDGGGTNPV